MLSWRSFLFLATCFSQVLSSDIRGDLNSAGIKAVFPGEPSYSSASAAFNLRFTFQPAAVTYPTSPKQIADIIKIGGSQNLQVIARSGGHSYIANGLGGKNGAIVVDLQYFNKVTLNRSAGTATIESGNRLGDIALALNKAGRALPHGTCPYVGIGGHSSYGGFGFTSRMWGLTLDNIVSISLVLANGTIATASQKQNTDLFWAMRGAGGSFGITTSIEVKTYTAPPSSTVFQYQWSLNVGDAAKALSAFQSFVQTDIPPQFGAEINLFRGPVSGNVTWTLTGGWYGAAQDFNATIAPLLKKLPKNPKVTLSVGTYINSVNYLGGLGRLDTTVTPDTHDTFYAKSLMTPQSSPMSANALTAFMRSLAVDGFVSKTDWFVQVELYGGTNSAINAIPLDASAFAHRSSIFTIQFYASSSSHQPPYPQSGFSFLDNVVNSIVSNSPKGWNYGAYPNYVDDKLSDWQLRYYGAHYQRLQRIKAQYDPKGRFMFPTGIDD